MQFPPNSISPKQSRLFFLRWKEVRTSLTEERITVGMLDTVMGKTKRHRKLTSQGFYFFFKSVLQKYSVLKWYEEYRISQRLLYSFLLLLSHTGQWWWWQTETHAIPVFPTAIDEKLPLHSNRLWQRIMRFIYSSLKSFWMSLFTAISIQQPFTGNMQYWIVQWPFKTMVYYNHYICY